MPAFESRLSGLVRLGVLAGVVLVGVVCLGLGPASANSRGSKPAVSESFFFRVSPIEAVAVPGSATEYTVRVTNIPFADAPYARWYLKVPASTGRSPCANVRLFGGERLGPGRYVWKNRGRSFIWYHGDCAEARPGLAGSPGTLRVVLENDSEHCSATFKGWSKGQASDHGPAAVCVLGGYLPFSVPRQLLRLYASVNNKLSALIQRVRSGSFRGSPEDFGHAIDAVLQPQRDAFKLFLPVWGCRFDGLFEPVLKGKSALEAQLANIDGGGRLPATARGTDTGDMTAILDDLRACTPTATRPIGVPAAVVAAVGALKARADALRARDDRKIDKAKLQLISERLDTIVKGFPAVFGIPYADLVTRVIAENAAIAAAKQAARSRGAEAATPALERAAGHERIIGRALRKEAKRAAKAKATA